MIPCSFYSDKSNWELLVLHQPNYKQEFLRTNGSKNFVIDTIIIVTLGVNQEVGKVSATDRDSGTNGEVKYSLLYTEDKSSPFAVNRETGSITTTGPLDFEKTQRHVLFIRADDSGLPLLSCKFNTIILKF